MGGGSGEEAREASPAWLSVAGQVEEQLPAGCGETEVSV